MNLGFSIIYVIIDNDYSWFSYVVLIQLFQLKGKNLMIQKRKGPQQACGSWVGELEETLFWFSLFPQWNGSHVITWEWSWKKRLGGLTRKEKRIFITENYPRESKSEWCRRMIWFVRSLIVKWAFEGNSITFIGWNYLMI